MTREQKAKAYDEVVARINKAVSDGLVSENFGRDMLGIAESEDERIGNLIYCIVRDREDVRDTLEANGVSVDDALSYLEKQKESDGKAMLHIAEKSYEIGKRDGKTEQKEQKSAEWSEEEKTIIDCAVEVVEKAGLPSLAASLKSLRPQPHWKPSEEQMKSLLYAEGHLRQYECRGIAKDIAKLYEDLKKL